MTLPPGCSRGIPYLDSVPSGTILPATVDVVVIGGGIVGSCAALDLAASGLRVLLCEKGRIGGEQSSRNWGWVRQMGRDAAEMPLTMAALDIWRSFQARGIQTGFTQTGITYVARTKRDRASFDRWENEGRTHDVLMRRLSGAALQELLPGLDPKQDEALHTPEDGRAEPGSAAPAIARGAVEAGAMIAQDCAVRGIETQAGLVSGVVTERGTVRCPVVLVAGGAWSRLFLRRHGIRFPQLRVVGTATRIEGEGLPDMPVGGGDFAVRRRQDGGFTVARRNANVAPITPDSFAFFTDFFPTYLQTWRELKLRVTSMSVDELRQPSDWAFDAPSPFERARMLDPDPDPAYVKGALRAVARAFPGASGLRATHAWGGVIDATPDAVPAIGPVPGRPGLFVASGFSGHGFGIGPGAGRLAADLVRGSSPVVDPAPFSPARFIQPPRSERSTESKQQQEVL
ncbi:FAD-binding oxidoreductase [uncultured Jannaschia sp.]|uniref:NAD(P)/FAD-dependent oxidoreductase n=1 Tax=uncultured Jannaschia sp. TaxID=293347 RepID=UPI00260B7FEE|nr:FAD-binding oxidoreductase [uncultured Jannaschia sp.]